MYDSMLVYCLTPPPLQDDCYNFGGTFHLFRQETMLCFSLFSYVAGHPVQMIKKIW